MDPTRLPYHLTGISTAFMARWLIAWQDGATIGCNFLRRSSSARQGVRLRNGVEYPVIFQNKADRIKETIYLQSPPIHGSVKIKRKWLNRLNLRKSIKSGRILKCSGLKTCWGLEQRFPHLHFNLAQQPITHQLTLDLDSSPTLTVILKSGQRKHWTMEFDFWLVLKLKRPKFASKEPPLSHRTHCPVSSPAFNSVSLWHHVTFP